MNEPIRLTEALAAISLTTDLATGVGFERGLRQCAVAVSLAELVGLDLAERRAAHLAALLRSIGCTAHAPENGSMFGDDIAFESRMHVLDWGDSSHLAEQVRSFGDWDPARADEYRGRLGRELPTRGPVAATAVCEVSGAICSRLGLPPNVSDPLRYVYERWDGGGIPAGVSAEKIPIVARVVAIAEQATLAYAAAGPAAAIAELKRRAGGQLDPGLCAIFVAEAERCLAPIGPADALAVALDAEPRPVERIGVERLARLAFALAAIGDLKGVWLSGHSSSVAALADRAAGLAAYDEAERQDLRIAALLHDIGRAAVPSSIWDRAAQLGPADFERVRLHPYWTARIIDRVPVLSRFAAVAAGHHERLDGSGYHRGSRGGELTTAARLLAAADVMSALGEERPHRAAVGLAEAAKTLVAEGRAGRLDPEACAAVVEAAGLPRRRPSWPADLSTREVEVLRLAARGLSNKQVGATLFVSAKTVQHHLANVYDKTGRRTRGGAAMFAIEHGLLPVAATGD